MQTLKSFDELPSGERPSRPKILGLSDILYFDEDYESSLKHQGQLALIEGIQVRGASDGIHGARLAIEVTEAAKDVYFRYLATHALISASFKCGLMLMGHNPAEAAYLRDLVYCPKPA